jgi:protocatechuate 3,4-dioxygenase beta subunit
MEQSQRRSGPARDRLSGRRLAKPAITIAALVAAVGGFLLFDNRHDADETAAPSPVSCDGHSTSTLDCLSSGTTAASMQPAVEGIDQQNPQEVRHPPDTRDRSPRRAWQQQDQAAVLVPGRTLVELCASTPAIAVSHCQAHTTGDLHALAAAGGNKDDEEGFSISGHVLSSEGQSLEGVSVVALPDRLEDDSITVTEQLRFWTVTDSVGAYSFSGLPAGEYTIRSARQDTYQPARVSARTGVDYADLVMNRNLELVVEGQVVGNFGEPIDGATVFPALLGQPSVQTGLDGRFELPLSVKPEVASLTLRFRMAGYREQSTRIRIGGYPESTTEEVRVVMDTVKSWTSLEGIVTDDAGDPLAGRRVELWPKHGRQTQSTMTDKAGRYAFSFVEAPADYRIVVTGGDGFRDVGQEVHVTTRMHEVELVAHAYQAGTVTGQLANQDGTPIADFQLVLRHIESNEPNAIVSTDSLGYFEIPEAPSGELVISSLSTPAVLVKGLELKPGERKDLPLVLDWGGHSIQGQVVDPRGNPVPASRVILNWSHRDELLNTQATRRTATDSHGRFAFSNLGPGPHSLKVDAPGFLGVDIDHDLSRQGYDLTVRLN